MTEPEAERPENVKLDIDVHPHYFISSSIGVDGEKPFFLQTDKPIPDPFAQHAVIISRKDLWKLAWRAMRAKKPARIGVNISGDWDAMKHVMTLRPIASVLPPDQAAERMVEDAFADGPNELDLRRGRNQPHTIWYWVDDPNDPVPAPYSQTLDTADEAESVAIQLVKNELANCERLGVESKLAWVKVFRADNEAYETFRYERGGPVPA